MLNKVAPNGARYWKLALVRILHDDIKHNRNHHHCYKTISLLQLLIEKLTFCHKKTIGKKIEHILVNNFKII